jgi:polygalacturonase
MKNPARILATSLCVAVIASRAFAADAPKGDEIVAALPVIPDAKFNLADFGGVGDGKTFNTDAFKSAIAAIEKAGGGHLIVAAGTYKTLPFTLTSHLDLHLEPGAVIKAPATFKDYGLPDPNDPLPEPAAGAASGGGRGRGRGAGFVAPLITGNNLTDVAITGDGTIDGSGAVFWAWSDKHARMYPPGRRIVFRPHLMVFTGMQRLHIDGITLTNSPMYHIVPSGTDMLFENIRIVAPFDAPNRRDRSLRHAHRDPPLRNRHRRRQHRRSRRLEGRVDRGPHVPARPRHFRRQRYARRASPHDRPPLHV